MAQKVIKIGDSLGITIPKKEVIKQNLTAGDEVDFSIRKKTSQVDKQAKILREYEAFVKQYGSTLKNLAER